MIGRPRQIPRDSNGSRVEDEIDRYIPVTSLKRDYDLNVGLPDGEWVGIRVPELELEIKDNIIVLNTMQQRKIEPLLTAHSLS